MKPVVDVAANLAQVGAAIDQVATRVGRSPAEITLVAVSKTHPVGLIRAALLAGQLDFGENRVEEAWAKFADPEAPDAVGARPLPGVDARSARLHLIGPIQSRKAALAVACQPLLIHAVDRLKIARRLDQLAAAAGLVLDGLIEVNIGGEASKFGFSPQELLATAGDLLTLSHLRVQGLMAMPPYDPDPEASRPYFMQLRQLRDQLARAWPQSDWAHLSMGMSHDFRVAIEEGATILRIGTAIFGARSAD